MSGFITLIVIYAILGILTAIWVHMTNAILYWDMKHRLTSIGLLILTWPYVVFRIITSKR